jgi:hypothetical protein
MNAAFSKGGISERMQLRLADTGTGTQFRSQARGFLDTWWRRGRPLRSGLARRRLFVLGCRTRLSGLSMARRSRRLCRGPASLSACIGMPSDGRLRPRRLRSISFYSRVTVLLAHSLAAQGVSLQRALLAVRLLGRLLVLACATTSPLPFPFLPKVQTYLNKTVSCFKGTES